MSTQEINHQKTITESMLFIEENLYRKISMEELLENSKMTEQTFQQQFEKHAKEAPFAYQTRLRAQHALLMLLLNKANLNEAHQRVGFESHADFLDATVLNFHQDPVDLVNRQHEYGDVIGYCKSFRAPKDTESRIQEINDAIEIKQCESLPVQFIRHVGSYKEAYKAWLSLAYQVESSYALGSGCEKIGIASDFPNLTPASNLRYDSALTIQTEFSSLCKQDIGSGLYAVYTHDGGLSSIDEILHFLLCQWIPNSPYQLRIKPIYFKYTHFAMTAFIMNKLEIHVYIPIENKNA